MELFSVHLIKQINASVQNRVAVNFFVKIKKKRKISVALKAMRLRES